MSAVERTLIEAGLDVPSPAWDAEFTAVTREQVQAELARPFAPFSLPRMVTLVSPAARPLLETMARQARQITLQRFGRVMLLYAPLYLSNFCVSYCAYCGFRRGAGVRRLRLTVDRALAEAELLARQGFQHLLLVAGEDPRYMTTDYLCQLVSALRPRFASIAIEIHQLEYEDYRRLARAGVDGVTLYQETYHRHVYSRVHTAGPKADYTRRLQVHDDAGRAGIRKLNLGALFGLTPWRTELLALALHAQHLLRCYWRSEISISLPRIRPTETQRFIPEHPMTDADLVHALVALRIAFPDVGLVLSTREPAHLRDRLCHLGVTQMSAGSRTNPGGYSEPERAERQFQISDERSADSVARFLEQQGFEPVWKDWDSALAGAEHTGNPTVEPQEAALPLSCPPLP